MINGMRDSGFRAAGEVFDDWFRESALTIDEEKE